MFIFLNGKLVDGKKAMVPVFDHGFLYGDGIFETLVAYGNNIWNPRAHMDRLFHGAKLMKMPLPWSKKQVVEWISKAVKKNGFKKSRIRLTVTRGLNHFDFMNVKRPTICIIVIPFPEWPRSYYTRGIRMITSPLERTYPAVKTTSLIANVCAQQAMIAHNCEEAIFINRRGHVTEGTTANIFFIKGNTLVVPIDETLAGTTKAIVIKLAKKIGMKVSKVSVSQKKMYGFDECFITSVTRGVMPARSIDGKHTKKQAPGTWTKRLQETFDTYVYRVTNS